MLYFGEHEQLSSPELVRASFWSLMTLSGIFGKYTCLSQVISSLHSHAYSCHAIRGCYGGGDHLADPVHKRAHTQHQRHSKGRFDLSFTTRPSRAYSLACIIAGMCADVYRTAAPARIQGLSQWNSILLRQTTSLLSFLSLLQPFLWWGSNVFVLGGSFAYTMVRRAEMLASAPPKPS